MTRKPCQLEALGDLESRVQRFESQWGTDPRPAIEAFLPAPGSGNRPEVLVELIRADLEFRWENGTPKRVETYLEEFPELRPFPDRIAQIAFEEFRTRTQLGEEVDLREYEKRLGVSLVDRAVPRDGTRWASRGAGVSNELRGTGEQSTRERARLKPGDSIAGFQIVESLGEGAVGAVYVATQTDLANRLVAIKVSRITREPEIVAQLQHTNIIPIFSVHRDGDFQVSCMPLLGLVTLQDVVRATGQERTGSVEHLISTVAAERISTLIDAKRGGKERLTGPSNDLVLPGLHRRPRLAGFHGRSTEEAWIWFFLKMAEGVRHAHQAGIVHRDLKPDNVLISDDGQPLILDFHLSATNYGQNQDGVGGTLPYMSPGQLGSLLTGEPVGAECDLHALGVMMYQVCTGELPFPDREGELISRVPAMIEDRRAGLPRLPAESRVRPSLASIIDHCVGGRGRRVYQTADQLCEDLQCCLDRRPLQHAVNRSWRERAANWMYRHPRLASGTGIGLLATALLIMAGLGLWSLGHRLKVAAGRDQGVAAVQFFQSATPQLASPVQDLGHSRRVVEQLAGEYETLGLGAIADLERKPAFVYSDPDVRKTLVQGAAHFHYWQADARRRLAAQTVGSGRDEMLSEALRWNRDALELVRAEPWAVCFQQQREALERMSSASEIRGDVDLPPPMPLADVLALENEEARFLFAIASYRNGDSDGASAILENVLTSRPTDPAVWYLNSLVSREQGRWDEAEASLTVAIGLLEEPGWAFAERGLLHLQRKEWAAAAQDYDRAIADGDAPPPWYLNRGLAKAGLEQWDAAVADYSQAIERNTDETRVFFLRSRLRKRLGDRAGAEADFERGLNLEPRDEASWIARGVARLPVDSEGALDDFANALAIDPDSRAGLENSAYVLAEIRNDAAAAIPFLERLVEAYPTDPGGYATLGVLLAREGQLEEAREVAQMALQRFPGPEMEYRVAGIYCQLGRLDPQFLDEALELLKTCAAQKPVGLAARMVADRDLAALAGDPRYDELKERLRALEPD